MVLLQPKIFLKISLTRKSQMLSKSNWLNILFSLVITDYYWTWSESEQKEREFCMWKLNKIAQKVLLWHCPLLTIKKKITKDIQMSLWREYNGYKIPGHLHNGFLQKSQINPNMVGSLWLDYPLTFIAKSILSRRDPIQINAAVIAK